MRKILFLYIFLSVSLNSFEQLCINEFLSLNESGITDENSDFSDWIEIFNKTDSTVNLAGYTITDDINIKDKWVFPEINVESYGHLLVFASGKDRNTFSDLYQTIIDRGDEWQYLLPTGQIDNTWHYSGFDGSLWLTGKSGFGYGDNDDSTILGSTVSVFIRKEFTLSNISSITSLILQVDYDDGFVAYINGNEIARVNLGSPGQDIAYNFATEPASHEATIYTGGIPGLFRINNPLDFLIEGVNVIAIQAHNSNITSSDLTIIPILSISYSGTGYTHGVSKYLPDSSKYLHTNFKISGDGEGLYLFNSLGSLVDSVKPVSLAANISYGRKPDGSGQWNYFGIPTPGESNITASIDSVYTDSVFFSIQGGIHIGGLTLTLSSNNPAEPIFYTTDGSIPSTNDILYQLPILINTSTVIRARVIPDTSDSGPEITNTYITAINHEFPVVCISTDSYNLWDNLTGIFAMGPNPGGFPYFTANFWQDWERQVHFEFYDTAGVKQIDQDAGMKVFGAWSRANEQKSVALYARKEYGKGSFEYKFFEHLPFDKFESIVLRNSGNDYGGLRFQDGFMTGLTNEMNVDKQAFQPAVVYINGEYWGILNIREKVNEDFIASNHSVDPDSVNIVEADGVTVTGSNKSYQEILSYLSTHSSLQNEGNYNWVADRIDMDNYIQYQLTQIYIDNRDWPGNNIKYWNTNSPAANWRWILFDTDFGFGANGNYTLNTLEFALWPNGSGWPNPEWSTRLFRRMISNQGFRNNFINQFADRINTDFKSAIISNRLDSFKTLYNNEIQYHITRWGGDYNNWLNIIEQRKNFGNLRPAYARNHIQDEFNLGRQLNVRIEVSSSSEGKVKINSVVPKNYPFNGIYFEDIPIKMTAVPNPGYKFEKWEGTINSSSLSIDYDMNNTGNFKAFFTAAVASDISVIINEINYNSSEIYPSKDWIELFNNGLATVDLSDWLLSDSGPDSGYVFPAGTIIAPGEYLLVYSELEKFKTSHPNVSNLLGKLSFGLSSIGDNIMLYDQERNLINSVEYSSGAPWDGTASGTGATLELLDPVYDNSVASNWKAGIMGGTPGMKNLWGTTTSLNNILTEGKIDFECFPNPFRDYTTIHFDVEEEGDYKLEVYDVNGSLINLLTDKYLIPGSYYYDWTGVESNGSIIPAGIYNIRLSTKKSVNNLKIIFLK